MRAPPLAPLALLALALSSSTAARAGRSLDEPAGWARLIKSAPRADVDKALADLALQERCADTLALRGTTDLRSVECRGAVVTALVRARPLETQADVDARTALFSELAQAAASVSTWAPLTPPPGLARARFYAHRALSGALISVYDDLSRARSRVALVDAWWTQSSAADPKAIACGAAVRTVELAGAGDVTLDERGAAQGVVTSRACGLDESRLRGAPKLGVALKDSADAAHVAQATSAEAAILAYAQSRSVDLERCKKHLDVAGKPKDADASAKLEQCACGAVARWKLPKPAAPTTTTIPVAGAAHVALDVAPTGAIAKCGPVEIR